MEKYVPFLQIFKGFFFGVLGFMIREKISLEPDSLILFTPIFVYVVLGLLDNVLSGHRFDRTSSFLSVKWIISSEDQLWFNIFLSVGFYFSLILYRNIIPVNERWLWLYLPIIGIPLTAYLELRRLKNRKI